MKGKELKYMRLEEKKGKKGVLKNREIKAYKRTSNLSDE